LVGDQQIETLPIPYTAVATDITNSCEVWLSKGSLFDAIRASISLPLFFTPVERRGARLIDGGCLNPVPIAPTFADEMDLTIAVNLGGDPISVDSDEPDTGPEEQSTEIQGWVGSMLADVRKSLKKHTSRDWGAYDVANEAFDAMQSTIARQKLAAYPPDIEIEIPRNACGTLEFNRAKEMIELGRTAARSALG
ncbi:MAG: patatin-like phospholipase family protein, partial [Woeseiaceae bacterium]|nr:patatin-like phospholipase family protein [Woeseiaceae bacterium]